MLDGGRVSSFTQRFHGILHLLKECFGGRPLQLCRRRRLHDRRTQRDRRELNAVDDAFQRCIDRLDVQLVVQLIACQRQQICKQLRGKPVLLLACPAVEVGPKPVRKARHGGLCGRRQYSAMLVLVLAVATVPQLPGNPVEGTVGRFPAGRSHVADRPVYVGTRSVIGRIDNLLHGRAQAVHELGLDGLEAIVQRDRQFQLETLQRTLFLLQVRQTGLANIAAAQRQLPAQITQQFHLFAVLGVQQVLPPCSQNLRLHQTGLFHHLVQAVHVGQLVQIGTRQADIVVLEVVGIRLLQIIPGVQAPALPVRHVGELD
ncbi:hypothetical protein D3C73_722210 [compost metagenome]